MSLATILVSVEPPARKEIPQWVAELIFPPVNDLGYQVGLFELSDMSYQKKESHTTKEKRTIEQIMWSNPSSIHSPAAVICYFSFFTCLLKHLHTCTDSVSLPLLGCVYLSYTKDTLWRLVNVAWRTEKNKSAPSVQEWQPVIGQISYIRRHNAQSMFEHWLSLGAKVEGGSHTHMRTRTRYINLPLCTFKHMQQS